MARPPARVGWVCGRRARPSSHIVAAARRMQRERRAPVARHDEGTESHPGDNRLVLSQNMIYCIRLRGRAYKFLALGTQICLAFRSPSAWPFSAQQAPGHRAISCLATTLRGAQSGQTAAGPACCCSASSACAAGVSSPGASSGISSPEPGACRRGDTVFHKEPARRPRGAQCNEPDANHLA